MQTLPKRMMLSFLLVILSISGSLPGCSRKDVDRKGQLKMRGEKAVSVQGKKTGDLLQKGTASWYGQPYHGRKTANGERYDMKALTAAHKSLPFGSIVRVKNLENGRSVKVRINDRGPFVRGRIIDLSQKAARLLGMETTGTAKVALYLAEGAPGSEARNETDDELAERGELQKSGYWTVQVGSFDDPDRAEQLMKRVRSITSTVWVERGMGRYRVRAGQLGSRDKADDLARSFLKENLEVWVLFVE